MVVEDVLFERGREVVRLVVDAAAGLQQGDGEGFGSAVARARECCVVGVLGGGVGFGVREERVDEYLVTDLWGDDAVVERGVGLGVGYLV